MLEQEQMNYVAKCIYQLKDTRGKLAKEQLLRNYATAKGFKEVLQFIYNPYNRTGIAKAKLAKNDIQLDRFISWQEAIEYFTNHQTGSNSDVYYAQMFIRCQNTIEAKELAIAMVTKNLQIGVSETTLNNVYGKHFIPVIDLMLGEPYKDFKTKVKPPFIVTEKFDGVRRLLMKRDGVITIYSRSGIPDEGLVYIETEARYLQDNMVYDGELLAIGDFPDSIALRQATNSMASTKGIKVGLTFNVFDMIPIREFDNGISLKTAFVRKVLVGALFKDASIKLLTPDYQEYIDRFGINFNFTFVKSTPILGVAHNEEEILALARPIWLRKFEGVMLNTFEGRYELKRTKELLKVKLTEKHVLKVIDILEGENKYTGMMGSLIVEYKGNRVGVGSGFSDEQRTRYWKRPENILGKEIQIETFGESTDKTTGKVSLNVPIFKRIVGEQE